MGKRRNRVSNEKKEEEKKKEKERNKKRKIRLIIGYKITLILLTAGIGISSLFFTSSRSP